MGIKEKLEEIIAKLQLIKNEQEAVKRESEKQSELLNPEKEENKNDEKAN